MASVDIVEGWSGPIDFQLKENGVAADLTGDTMTAEAVDRRRQPTTLTGDLSIISATDGKIRLTPDTGDFIASASPYELRFKRTTIAGIVFYPNGEAVRVDVRSWVTT